MIKILIGHRGTGKTSLLRRLQNYFPEQQYFDLDQEIEKRSGMKISELFEKRGEAEFRNTEKKYFQEILKESSNAWISLGAGFELSTLPAEGVEVIWVRRRTDSLGRVFFGRPRLNPKLSPLEEFQARFGEREANFKKHFHWIYDMPEGVLENSTTEKTIFQNRIAESSAAITVANLDPGNLQRIATWNIRYFEFRDDGYTDKESIVRWMKFKSAIPKDRQLFSFRAVPSQLLQFQNELPGIWDWPIELGESGKISPILSLHERLPGESLQHTIGRLEQSAKTGQHLKLAVYIESFQELDQALAWQAARPEERSFLPRSPNGRWAWVRLWLKGRQKINFVREGLGSAEDQPTWWEWISTPEKPTAFGAVLGAPIFYSRSPAFHQSFFAEKEMPFWPIHIIEDEWEEAMSVLEKLGLVAAAVTSPLKRLAGGNTLWREKGNWQLGNTDLEGLSIIAAMIPIQFHQSVAVWGGGGTLPIIKQVFPEAILYSQRTGELRNSNQVSKVNYDVVVWAATPEAAPPDFGIRPKYVLDLNYREDSRAREYALLVGAEYVSGEKMFVTQALGQQRHWHKIGRREIS